MKTIDIAFGIFVAIVMIGFFLVGLYFNDPSIPEVVFEDVQQTESHHEKVV